MALLKCILVPLHLHGADDGRINMQRWDSLNFLEISFQLFHSAMWLQNNIPWNSVYIGYHVCSVGRVAKPKIIIQFQLLKVRRNQSKPHFVLLGGLSKSSTNNNFFSGQPEVLGEGVSEAPLFQWHIAIARTSTHKQSNHTIASNNNNLVSEKVPYSYSMLLYSFCLRCN